MYIKKVGLNYKVGCKASINNPHDSFIIISSLSVPSSLKNGTRFHEESYTCYDYQFDSNPFVLYSWHIFQKEGLDTILNADMVPSKFSFAREK